MRRIEQILKPINVELLVKQLQDILPDVVYGVNVETELIVIYVDDNITRADVDVITRIVALHNADELTPEQETILIRQEAIVSERESLVSKIDVDTITVQELARWVNYLLDEIRDLRGLY